MKNISFQKSSNFNQRPQDAEIDMILVHYTGMRSEGESIKILLDPNSKVSAHYLICESGKVIQMIDDELRAWHAGLSEWRGQKNVNDFSIGIELSNPGHEHGYRDFTKSQINSFIELTTGLKEKYNIKNHRILGHSDVSPDRKMDPGEKFDWKFLASHQIGLWLKEEEKNSELVNGFKEDNSFVTLPVRTAQENLKEIGYSVNVNGLFDEVTKKVVIAFQRHFCPENLSGILDKETFSLIALYSKITPGLAFPRKR